MSEKNYASLAFYTRQCLLVSYACLALVVTLGTLVWPSCSRSPNGVVWAIQMLVLLAFLPGVIKRNLRTHIWLTFVLLFFFIASVSTAFACTSLLTVAEVFFVMELFITAMLYVRWQARSVKQQVS